MRNVLRLTVFAAVAALALPVFADDMQDLSKLSCKDMMALDAAGLSAVGVATKSAIMADDTMKNDVTINALDPQGYVNLALAKCKGHDDLMVIDALKM